MEDEERCHPYNRHLDRMSSITSLEIGCLRVGWVQFCPVSVCPSPYPSDPTSLCGFDETTHHTLDVILGISHVCDIEEIMERSCLAVFGSKGRDHLHGVPFEGHRLTGRVEETACLCCVWFAYVYVCDSSVCVIRLSVKAMNEEERFLRNPLILLNILEVSKSFSLLPAVRGFERHFLHNTTTWSWLDREWTVIQGIQGKSDDYRQRVCLSAWLAVYVSCQFLWMVKRMQMMMSFLPFLPVLFFHNQILRPIRWT